MQLPLKTRMLQYAIEKDGAIFNKDDVMKDLANEYPGERLFSEKQVAEYLDELLVVGFLKKEKTSFDENGSLLIDYSISDYGRSRAKYLK